MSSISYIASVFSASPLSSNLTTVFDLMALASTGSSAAALSEDAGTLEDVYEPYLLQNGFIIRTPKGRVVTDHAYAHLGIPHDEKD